VNSGSKSHRPPQQVNLVVRLLKRAQGSARTWREIRVSEELRLRQRRSRWFAKSCDFAVADKEKSVSMSG
jgi:hypothetical protein